MGLNDVDQTAEFINGSSRNSTIAVNTSQVLDSTIGWQKVDQQFEAINSDFVRAEIMANINVVN